MANISIKIEADAMQAKKTLAELSESLENSGRSSKSIRTEMAKLQTALRQGTTKDAARDQAKLNKLAAEYATALSIETNGIVALKGGYQGVADAIRKMEKEAVELRKAGLTSAANELDAKAKKLKSSLDDLSQSAKKTGTSFKTGLGDYLKGLVGTFTAVGLAVAVTKKAFSTLKKTLSEAATAAAEAEETYNLFITTFENVSSSAVRTANSLSSSLGTATSTMQKALGTFGDLMAGYGATDKAALEFASTAAETALDIVSFKNVAGDLETTFQSIASGLAGNTENFRRLGYVITAAEVKSRLASKGLDKLTGSALQQAQVQERLNLLIEKSSKAQGDMIKTLDSTENVNRRLTEAWKEQKETLGTYVNKVLTPIKSWWVDILETMNKAQKAQKEIMAGAAVSSAYDVTQNPKDYQRLVSELQRQVVSGGGGLATGVVESMMRQFGLSPDQLESAMKDVAINLMGTGEGALFSLAIDTYKKEAEALYRVIEEQKAASQATEEHSSAIQEQKQKITNLADALTELGNVDIAQYLELSLGMLDSVGPSDKIPNTAKLYLSMVDKAFSDIGRTTSLNWTDPVTLALEGDLDEAGVKEALNKKLEALRSLYEQAMNEFTLNDLYGANGELIAPDEERELETIVNLYRTISKSLAESADAGEELAEAMEDVGADAEAALLSMKAFTEKLGAENATASRNAIIASMYKGASEEEISLRQSHNADVNELWSLYKNAKNAALAIEDLSVQSDALERVEEEHASALAELNESYLRQADELRESLATKAIEDFRDALSRLAEYTESISEANLISADTKRLNAVYGGDEERAKLEASYNQELRAINQAYVETQAFAMAIESATEQAIALKEADAEHLLAVEALREKYTELRDSIASPASGAVQGNESGSKWWEQLINADSRIASIASSAESLADSLASGMNVADGVVGLILSIVEQLDVWQGVLSIVDAVIENINKILEPLMPVFEACVELVDSLMVVLEPLIPIIQIIATVIVTAVMMVKAVVDFVADSIKKAIGYLFGWIEDLINGALGWLGVHVNWGIAAMRDIDPTEGWNNNINKMNELLGKIWGSNEEIADNTAKDDEIIKYLGELRKKGVIDELQYAGLLSERTGTDYNKVQLLDGASYYQGAMGESYIHNGNIIITIDGTNMTPDELADAIRRAESWRGSPGGNTYLTGYSTGRV